MMAPFRNFLKRKARADSGEGAVFILTFFSIFLIVLVVSWQTSAAQASKDTSDYVNVTQDALQAGIGKLTPSGNLSERSVVGFADKYAQLYSDLGTSAGSCGTAEIYDETVKAKVKRQVPYAIVKLETARGENGKTSKEGATSSVSYTIEGNQFSTLGSKFNKVQSDGTGAANGKYKVLSAEVYTSTSNSFAMLGFPSCQVHKTSAKAVSFGSNTDIGN